MSCSLTYEDDLGRVRIDADTLCQSVTLVDTFSRTVSGTWGSANSGQAWVTSGGSTGEYSVQSGFGRHNNVTENVFRNTVLDINSINCDYTIEVRTDKLAAGANSLTEICGRWTDAQNYYSARLTFTTTGAMTIDVRKRVVNVVTVMDTATISGTHTINTNYSVRVHIYGDQIKAKAWLSSDGEPDSWIVEAVDTALTSGDQIALRTVLSSATSNEPVLFSFDNLQGHLPEFATVDRTVDGFNYTIVRGASEVGITTGCELERIVDDYEFPTGQVITYRVRSYGAEGSEEPFATTTCQITVDLDRVWLKSLGRPFLNRSVECVRDLTSITRRARNNISNIVNRSYPVAVTDLRGSREGSIAVVTQTTQERQDVDLLLASGDPIYIQTPYGYPIPTMYTVIEDTEESRPVKNRNCNNDWRLFELPFVEVAAPGPDVVGTLGTWQTVVNTYLTWTDVLNNHPTWADLLELIGDSNEVIVP